ncbi:MAG: hypothetical protein K6U89_03545 [Chloroflexi bacterium]|nr:hypothetical protein [Chloroflexota bacterium]
MNGKRIGEVLQATTTSFVASCDELHCPPDLGALVYASNGQHQVLGLVSAATTTSPDPGRPAIPRGREAASEEEVFRNHPQLAKLLRTDFTAQVVGFWEGNQSPVHQYLPARPPQIHAFVYPASPDLVERFFQQVDYLWLLARAPTQVPVEELMAASVRQAKVILPPERYRALAVRAGQELVRLFEGDPKRVDMVLGRIWP